MDKTNGWTRDDWRFLALALGVALAAGLLLGLAVEAFTAR